MAVVSMKSLLEAGVHFGHQTRRWNPKMKPYIFTERGGIYILDLQQTLELIETTYEFVKKIVSQGEDILFIGTKKQAQDAVKNEATRCEMPYVNYRWLGGTLTNFDTIRKRIERLSELEDMTSQGVMELLPKKEVLKLKGEKLKLERNLGGIRDMNKLPGAIYIADTRKERIAVQEAWKKNIPIVAILDTNCDPDEVDYIIPGNDDAIRSITLITRTIANAALEGKQEREALEEKTKEAEKVARLASSEAEEKKKEKSIEVAKELDVSKKSEENQE